MNASPAPAQSPSQSRQGWWWLGAAVALTALKLWFTRGQSVFAIGAAAHDDRLFLQLGEYLTQGRWLGPYDQTTLAKGPFYPLWIAAMALLHVPLFFSQQLLYATSCAALVRACAPLWTRPAAACAFYALLLWNPITYDASSLGRVLRQHVYSPLAFFIFAGLIALYFLRRESLRRQLPWAALLGFSAAAFWLTREESVWILPSVLLLATAVLIGAGAEERGRRWRSLASLGVALACAVAPLLVVSALNYRHYGWFGTVEFRAPEFNDAYGAMVRVKVGPDLPRVPVTRAAREAMYAVSPTFAQLAPHLEGAVGRGWATASTEITGKPADELEIGGGWMMWALRDATAAAGHHRSAGDAMKFYRAMADEINAAANDGRLPAGPPRSGFVPVWREGQIADVVKTLGRFAHYVVSFESFNARAPRSEGSEDLLGLFRAMTHERLSPSAEGETPAALRPGPLDHWRVGALNTIGGVLRAALHPLFWTMQLVAAVCLALRLRMLSWSFPLTLAAAAWGAGTAYLLIQAIVHVTSFPVMVISSFASAYPLALLFIGATAWEVAILAPAWFAHRRARLAAPRRVSTGPEWFGSTDSDAERTPANAFPPAVARWLPWVMTVLALAPLGLWRARWQELFWFGDDFMHVNQIAEMGFWHWLWEPFAENIVPVFKLAWGGALFAFGGSYFAVLALMALTHAFNTWCLGRVLTRAGLPWLAVALTQLVFAVSVVNLETLGWSVQWSAILATTFLLLGLLWQQTHRDDTGRWSLRTHAPLWLAAAASACCFSRGVLTGGVLALAVLTPLLEARHRSQWARRALLAALALAPAVAVVALIMRTSGNHVQMTGHWLEAARWAAGFFLVNPGYHLLGYADLNTSAVATLSAVKLGVLAGGFYFAHGRLRQFLLLLLAYDLGNAVLLGVGRYHTGFGAVVNTRYYYGSLLAVLPFAGICVARGLEFLAAAAPTRARLRHALAAVLLLGLLAFSLAQWPRALEPFAQSRGTELRRVMFDPALAAPTEMVPALDFMPVERAKALVRAYDLH